MDAANVRTMDRPATGVKHSGGSNERPFLVLEPSDQQRKPLLIA